jgi:hypothetical protein
MSGKLSSIILGFLLIIGGIFYFFRDIITVSYSAVCAAVIGAAFIALYFNKKKKWAILPGVYLFYLGIANVFFSDLAIYSYIVTSIFFLAPGTILLVLYYSSDKSSPLLTFGLILLELGICVLLTGLYDFNNVNILLLCIGIGFMLNYLLDRDYKNKTPLWAGVILTLLSIRKFLYVNGYTDLLISSVLIIIGFVVIVRALFSKEA